ncbi:MAG: TlpA family protein disulfide reductase [Bacteroidales bacterium]|nr:TlpA family protein disulfide reductase [Bacteroidales bacterium]
MNNPKILILFTFLIATLIGNTISAKTNVDIYFPGAEGKTATIWTYKDLISLKREVVETVRFDEQGNISFKVYNNEVKNYFVEVRYLRITFLLEANKDYSINIDKVDFSNRDLYPKNVIGYLSPNFSISIKGEQGLELNKELDSLKLIFDDFASQNHLSLIRGNNSKHLVDSLEETSSKYIKIHTNPYLQTYANIQMAQFRKLSRQYGDDYIVTTYFAKDKIAYYNPAFMAYFNAFWTKYIDTRMRFSIRKKLDSVINVQQSYQSLSALVSEDPLLADDNLRELVILRNIPQLYFKEGISKKALINILYDISASKQNSEHKQIAINMRKRLENNTAYDFSFIDSNNDTLSLSSQKGKYVYIQLFDNECIECLAQMQYTNELYEEFDDIITFIHVSLDRSNEDMLNSIKGKAYPWHFVFLEDNYSFINNYQISVIPQAILIDKDGSIIDLDAVQPSDYFKDTFLKMLNDRKGNLNQQNNPMDGIRVR